MSEKLHERIGELQEQLRQGAITRRDFLRYAALLGLSVGAAEALAACAPQAAPTAAPTVVPPPPTSVPVGAATSAPPAPPPTAAPSPAAPAAQAVAVYGREVYVAPKTIAFIEVEDMKCFGCGLCEEACSMQHFGVINKELARIRVEHHLLPLPKGIVVSCVQCQEAERECQKACPLTPPAISFDDKTMHMVVDANTCLGIKCNQCGEACTAGAIHWYTSVQPTPFVCDLCDVTNSGNRDPQCVAICPSGALHFHSPTGARHWLRKSHEEKAALIARRVYPLTKDSYFKPELEV
jgi:carbon-monoxide dehydrogenase iron sulfur subunit